MRHVAARRPFSRPEQICQIMALACEDPERLDVPISQWSQSELALRR